MLRTYESAINVFCTFSRQLQQPFCSASTDTVQKFLAHLFRGPPLMVRQKFISPLSQNCIWIPAFETQ